MKLLYILTYLNVGEKKMADACVGNGQRAVLLLISWIQLVTKKKKIELRTTPIKLNKSVFQK